MTGEDITPEMLAFKLALRGGEREEVLSKFREIREANEIMATSLCVYVDGILEASCYEHDRGFLGEMLAEMCNEI